MKNIAKMTIMSVVLLLLVFSCKSPVIGMWIDNFEADGTGTEYWITFDEESNFEFVKLATPFTIDMYYIGTYEADKDAETVTLTATEQTTGENENGDYVWEDSTWTKTCAYTSDGGELTITVDGTDITLVEREQPINLMRDLGLEE